MAVPTLNLQHTSTSESPPLVGLALEEREEEEETVAVSEANPNHEITLETIPIVNNNYEVIPSNDNIEITIMDVEHDNDMMYDDESMDLNSNRVAEKVEKATRCDPFHEGYLCNVCEESIQGYRYTCVQCRDFDLCSSCEAKGSHFSHYVLRIPEPRALEDLRAVLSVLRRQLYDEKPPPTFEHFDPVVDALKKNPLKYMALHKPSIENQEEHNTSHEIQERPPDLQEKPAITYKRWFHTKKSIPKIALLTETLPKKTLPHITLPEITLPQITLPEIILPEVTLPEKTLPKKKILGTTLPETILPKKILPKQKILQTTLPEKTLSEETLPKKTLPKKTLPEKNIPKKNVPKKIILEKTLPEKASPMKNTLPEKTLPWEMLSKKKIPEKSLARVMLPDKILPTKIPFVCIKERLTQEVETELQNKKESNILTHQKFCKDLSYQPKSNLLTTGEVRVNNSQDSRQYENGVVSRQNSSKNLYKASKSISKRLRSTSTTKQINKEPKQETARPKIVFCKSKFIRKAKLKTVRIVLARLTQHDIDAAVNKLRKKGE